MGSSWGNGSLNGTTNHSLSGGVGGVLRMLADDLDSDELSSADLGRCDGSCGGGRDRLLELWTDIASSQEIPDYFAANTRLLSAHANAGGSAGNATTTPVPSSPPTVLPWGAVAMPPEPVSAIYSELSVELEVRPGLTDEELRTNHLFSFAVREAISVGLKSVAGVGTKNVRASMVRIEKMYFSSPLVNPVQRFLQRFEFFDEFRGRDLVLRRGGNGARAHGNTNATGRGSQGHSRGGRGESNHRGVRGRLSRLFTVVVLTSSQVPVMIVPYFPRGENRIVDLQHVVQCVRCVAERVNVWCCDHRRGNRSRSGQGLVHTKQV